ncbi:hypothetical protein [Acidithiobacillus thiooxidans]|uniref:hypothetical protein n=1 Tax=Acidithiobacillus thiooxidans TaxID=930 RepID=UPI0004E147B4|nr:hypothetical protein [Acidithiobacillus thiooxidans]
MRREKIKKVALIAVLTALPLQAMAATTGNDPSGANVSDLFSLKVRCAEKMEANGENVHQAGQICGCFFNQLQKNKNEMLYLQNWRKDHPKTPINGKFGNLVDTQAQACISAEQSIQKDSKKIQKINKENAITQQFNTMLTMEISKMLTRTLAEGARLKTPCSARVTFATSGVVTKTGVSHEDEACPQWVYMRLDNAYVPINPLWQKVVKSPLTVTVEVSR